MEIERKYQIVVWKFTYHVHWCATARERDSAMRWETELRCLAAPYFIQPSARTSVVFCSFNRPDNRTRRTSDGRPTEDSNRSKLKRQQLQTPHESTVTKQRLNRMRSGEYFCKCSLKHQTNNFTTNTNTATPAPSPRVKLTGNRQDYFTITH